MNCRNYIECIKENERIHMIGVDRLKILKEDRGEPDNMLFSLSQSIRRYGFIQPICVKKHYFDNCFDVVAGTRRLKAARLLKMRKIPCIIMDAENERASEISLIENISRQELGLFEEADAILRLKDDYSMTQEELARDLCVSQSYISNRLRMLKFSETERKSITENELTERHCRALLRIINPEKRKNALYHIIRNKLTVPECEAYIEELLCEVKKCRINDLGVFYNSINNAVNSAKKLGAKIVKEESENEREKTINIKVEKSSPEF